MLVRGMVKRQRGKGGETVSAKRKLQEEEVVDREEEELQLRSEMQKDLLAQVKAAALSFRVSFDVG